MIRLSTQVQSRLANAHPQVFSAPVCRAGDAALAYKEFF
jgi:hypothetical protein